MKRAAEHWDAELKKEPQNIRSADNAELDENIDKIEYESAENSAVDPQETARILKSQWEEFAQNLAQGMPPKDAAICAGYSPSRAEAQATTLWKRPEIRARVKELRSEAALLVSSNAGHLAQMSYDTAKEARKAGKFGQVAPNIKHAAQLTGIDMGSGRTEVNVDLAGLSYGKVCIVTPASCPPEVWATHMGKLSEGKQIAQS